MVLSKQFKAIEMHLDKYFNKNKEIAVFHEIVSPYFHLDVYWIKSTKYRNYTVLMTNGISSISLEIPEKQCSKYIELCILLPPEWDLKDDNWRKPENYWPIELIKNIGCLPAMNNTWLGYSHTIQLDEPIGNTQFVGAVLLKSISLPIKFQRIKFGTFFEKNAIELFLLYPLFEDEIELVRNKGIDELLKLFEENNLTDIVDVNRTSVCKK